MKKILALLLLSVTIISCDRVKQTAKDAVNKTGETVGAGASEFVEGVSSGVDKTIQCSMEISKALTDEGLSHGKIVISSFDSGTDNLMSVYLIFDKDLKKTVSVKVFDVKGEEYGRVNQKIEGKKGEAKYFDFSFDKRTNIETQSKFVVE